MFLFNSDIYSVFERVKGVRVSTCFFWHGSGPILTVSKERGEKASFGVGSTCRILSIVDKRYSKENIFQNFFIEIRFFSYKI